MKRSIVLFLVLVMVISVSVFASAEKEATIKIISGAVGQEYEMAQEIASRYMKENPNVKIEVFDSPDAVQDRLAVYLQYLNAKSSEVDIYQIDVIWPGDLAEHLIDLNKYGLQEAAKDHFPRIVQNNTVDGALLAMPFFTDAGLLYYRTDLLEKYGFNPPKTWDELEEAAAAIQKGERAAGNADLVGFVWQGNAYEGLTCDALEWIDSSYGGTVISPDKVITINNKNAIAAVDKAAGWVGTISPKGVTAFQEEDARNIWQGGNAVFMRNWPYAYSLGNAEDSAVAGKFDVCPLPSSDGKGGAAALGGWQLAVSKYSKNPEVAADVVEFFTNYESQKYRAIIGSLNPTIMPLYKDKEVLDASPFFGSLYDVFINATPRPSTATAPNYNAVSVAFFQAVHSVLTGGTDAADAFESLELELKDITGFDIE
ncbi:MAG: ABC transporter substrate-binding protein [Candidatus Caldatribacteriota bacterium]|nr:ABC transporter substrate-binding protein [Candidatus Caldatribacteriota bacterium]